MTNKYVRVAVVFLSALLVPTLALPYLWRTVGKESIDYLSAGFTVTGGLYLLWVSYHRAPDTPENRKRAKQFAILGFVLIGLGLLQLLPKLF